MAELSHLQKLEQVVAALQPLYKDVDFAPWLKQAQAGQLSEEQKKEIDFLASQGRTLVEYLIRSQADEKMGIAQGETTSAMRQPAEFISMAVKKVTGMKAYDSWHQREIADSVKEFDSVVAQTLKRGTSVMTEDALFSNLEAYASANKRGLEGDYPLQRRLNPKEIYNELLELKTKLDEADSDRGAIARFLRNYLPALINYQDPDIFYERLNELIATSKEGKRKGEGDGKLAEYILKLSERKITEKTLKFVKPKPAEQPRIEAPKPAPAAPAKTQEKLEERVGNFHVVERKEETVGGEKVTLIKGYFVGQEEDSRIYISQPLKGK